MVFLSFECIWIASDEKLFLGKTFSGQNPSRENLYPLNLVTITIDT